MPLARSWSISLLGLDGHVVEIEADLANGIPGLAITGLPDASLVEARDRVRAAMVNSGHAFPAKRVTLGLSPASLRKRGSGFDMALAAAVLAADGALPGGCLNGLVLIGELGLDGRVRAVSGVLPSVLAAARAGFRQVVVPLANAAEARLLPEMQVTGVDSLRSLVAHLRGEWTEPAPPAVPVPASPLERGPDLADVAGQPVGRFALEVAAAGGHHLFMTGPPGCGKTLLAERLPGLLPALSLEEALEVTAIHSVAEQLPADFPLVTRPPFQAPHHGATAASVVGGGSGVARPGAASLAHRGVLFLDEAPEFRGGVLDALRQPLESGSISIRRVGGTATYPARFTLVLAANPCPCAKGEKTCVCRPQQRLGYLGRLSGPLLDRLDLQIALPAITRADVLADAGTSKPSAAVAAKVAHARDRAIRRYRGTPWRINAEVPVPELQRCWPVPRTALNVLGKAMDDGHLTARGYARVLRMAWTVADLEGSGVPGARDAQLALSLRLGALATGLAA